MRFNLHVYVHYPEDEEGNLLSRLILGKLEQMSNELSTLTEQVSEMDTTAESAIVLLNGLKAKFDAAIASGSPAALQALSDALGAEKGKLAAAITANTPQEGSPVFETPKLPAMNVGTQVDFQFVAAGALGFALGTGSLPPGLTQDNMGHLTGMPTTEGQYTFSETASNAAGTVDSGPLMVLVSPASAVTPVVPAATATAGVMPASGKAA